MSQGIEMVEQIDQDPSANSNGVQPDNERFANLPGILPEIVRLEGTKPVVTITDAEGRTESWEMAPEYGDYQLYKDQRVVSISMDSAAGENGESSTSTFKIRPRDRLILNRVDPLAFTDKTEADVPEYVVHPANKPLPEEHGFGWGIAGIIRGDRLHVLGTEREWDIGQKMIDLAILNTLADTPEARAKLAQQLPRRGSLADWIRKNQVVGTYLDYVDDTKDTGIMAAAETLAQRDEHLSRGVTHLQGERQPDERIEFDVPASHLFGKWRDDEDKPSLAESIVAAEHAAYPTDKATSQHPNVFFMREPDSLNPTPEDPTFTVVITSNPGEKEAIAESTAAIVSPPKGIPYMVLRHEEALAAADRARAATHV